MHGRVEKIKLFNRDPYPPRKPPPDDKKMLCPKVPPVRRLKEFLALRDDRDVIKAKVAIAEKKMADQKAAGEYVDPQMEAEIEAMYGTPEERKRFAVLD